MTIKLLARPDLLRSQRRSTVARALAFVVAAVFVLCLSLSAEAKKKKSSKKGKTPAASSKKKSTGSEAAPADESESDEAGSDEKPSTKKSPDEGDDKEASKPPPPPPDADAEGSSAHKKPPAKVTKEPAEGEGTTGGLEALRFGLGGKALFRNLSWTDDNGALAPYKLTPGPEIAAWLEVYPAAFTTDGFAANIGVFGSFDYGIGAQSKLQSGTILTTKYQDFLAGLKVRIPVGMFIPNVSGAYGMQKFHLEPADNSRPNFNYAFFRAGGGARVQFTPLIDMDLGLGYLIVLNPGSQAGEVKALYPNVKASGVDATLSVGLRVTSLIGVRVGGDFRQYGTSLHYPPGPVPAGGATDRYMAAWGSIEILLDGVGGGGGEGEAAPAKKAPPKAKKAPPSEDGDTGVNTDKDEKASDVE